MTDIIGTMRFINKTDFRSKNEKKNILNFRQ